MHVWSVFPILQQTVIAISYSTARIWEKSFQVKEHTFLERFEHVLLVG